MMTKRDAIYAMIAKNALVRCTYWEPNLYIFIDNNGSIVDQGGNNTNILNYEGNSWEKYERAYEETK